MFDDHADALAAPQMSVNDSRGGNVMFPVEIKVNIAGTSEAASVLSLAAPDAANRSVWFAEDEAGLAAGALTLFASHAIIRLRAGDGRDDITVKWRPCDFAHLGEHWKKSFTAEGFEYRIEEDWAGQRRVLAASAVTTPGSEAVMKAVLPGARPETALSERQRQFLDARWPSPAALGHLVALGPIKSSKWEDVPIGELSVTAERWTVGALDFLELSMRVVPDAHESPRIFSARAQAQQAGLEAAVAGLGLGIDDHADTKTQRVLTALAA